MVLQVLKGLLAFLVGTVLMGVLVILAFLGAVALVVGLVLLVMMATMV